MNEEQCGAKLCVVAENEMDERRSKLQKTKIRTRKLEMIRNRTEDVE